MRWYVCVQVRHLSRRGDCAPSSPSAGVGWAPALPQQGEHGPGSLSNRHRREFHRILVDVASKLASSLTASRHGHMQSQLVSGAVVIKYRLYLLSYQAIFYNFIMYQGRHCHRSAASRGMLTKLHAREFGRGSVCADVRNVYRDSLTDIQRIRIACRAFCPASCESHS